MANAPVSLVNADAISRAMLQIRKRTPPPDLASLIGTAGVRDVRRGIREQRSPDGRPYKKVQRFGQAGQRLQNTRRMLNSITFQVLSARRVIVGTNAKQAATMHFGDDNRTAKNGKYLAIPMSRQVAAANTGSFRQQYPDAFVLRLSGRSFGAERLFIVRKLEKGQRGAAGTVFKLKAGEGRAKKGIDYAGARLQFLAMLVKRVRIPATPFLGISKQGEKEIVRVAEVSISKVLQQEGAK
jgi:phage gpG-like protein